MAKIPSTEHALKHSWHSITSEEIRQLDYCRTVIIGIGGAGNNTVSRLMEMGVTNAECVAVNTDVLHLNVSKAHQKILIGKKTAKGLGVNGNPKIGRAAIEESRKSIEEVLSYADIIFVTAGLGGGTGTGAAPIIAEIARQKGAITIGVITTPFRKKKSIVKHATTALTELRMQCDTVVVIDNNRLMHLVPQLPINEAFRVADQMLANIIKDMTETISSPCLMSLDFADFKTILRQGGVAFVGVGESNAPNRAEEAVRNALRSPLLNADYAGATGALIHVTGDNQMTIEEANRVGEIVTEMMDHEARVIWGARVNPEQSGKLKVTLVMTGLDSPHVPSGLRTIMPQLFNLEPHAEPEKPLGLDLGLYQMENFH